MEILTLYTNGCPKCKVIESEIPQHPGLRYSD